MGEYLVVYEKPGLERPKYCFFVGCKENYVNAIKLSTDGNYNYDYDYFGGSLGNYVTKKMYQSKKELYGQDYNLIEICNYKFYMEQDKSFIQIANTSYMFNYEGEPNEGYFFINDFERGRLIEDTPYEPRREGYTFAGWYKEPECVNAWDFTKDTLPAAEYDEEGNLLFVETKLYAKWNKN